MKYQINYENAIANRGNLYRMKKLMKRAMAGEKITIGFLGGSITQGSLSTKPELCYAYHVYKWWCETFPQAEFIYRNAGIGATNSQFACARAESDLLAYEPDFVVVDFSVNDESTEHFLETYEGVIRKVYAYKTKPAVLLLHNVCYDNGGNAQLMHGKVGRYYDLPEISMQSSIYPALVSGTIENRLLTPDDLHPNDEGHALVASIITCFLEKVRQNVEQTEQAPLERKAPFTMNAYENSIRYRNDNCKPVLNGFVPDETPQEGITDIFKNGWTANLVGASIVFQVPGSCIGVQYRKTIQLPAPIAEVIIDDDLEHTVKLDANFDETWGDKLVLDTIAEHIENKMHRVEIRLVTAHERDKLPFYLVSVIGSGEK